MYFIYVSARMDAYGEVVYPDRRYDDKAIYETEEECDLETW